MKETESLAITHLPEPSVEGPPAVGIGICWAVCALGLDREAGGLRATGASSRRKRMLWPLGSVLCVYKGRRCAGPFLLPCRVNDTEKKE